jgi:choline dehydrogenase-like flavoprotein
MGAIVELRDYLDRLQDPRPDVLIVGTGPAGFFTALRLSELGRRVVVVDAGGERPDLDAMKYFELDNGGFPAKRANIGLSWQLGGASNLWAGRVAPMEPEDISAKNGWPHEYAALVPYFDRAARIMGLASMAELKAETAEPENASEWIRLMQDERISLKRFQWSTPPFNTRLALRDAVARFPALHVVTGARVLSFEASDDGDAVSSVVVAAPDGTQYSLSAPTYVLAAGGIESPRILLNSDGKSGLGNGNDLVGRCFSTHPKMNIGTLELKRPVAANSPLFSDVSRGKHNLRFGIGLLPTGTGDTGLNHYVQFSQRFEKIGAFAIEEAQRLFSGSSGRAIGTGPIGSAAVVTGRILFNALGRSGIWRKRATRLTLRGFFDQHAQREHRIALSDDRDPFGMRKARIHWDLSARDIASIRRFAADLTELFASHDIGTLHVSLPDDPRDWPLTSIHSHFLGTLRMGTDAATSVTDPDGRLHSVANLYVCGSSVFPSYGNANPFLTIAATALRTAERIAANEPIR